MVKDPDEVRHAGGITEGTRLEFCSTELILQAKEGRTSIQKMAVGLRDLNNVPEVTWEDVASRGEKVIEGNWRTGVPSPRPRAHTGGGVGHS